jgi:hypothetical protein
MRHINLMLRFVPEDHAEALIAELQQFVQAHFGEHASVQHGADTSVLLYEAGFHRDAARTSGVADADVTAEGGVEGLDAREHATGHAAFATNSVEGSLEAIGTAQPES